MIARISPACRRRRCSAVIWPRATNNPARRPSCCSHTLWQSRYGGDPHRRIADCVNTRPTTVVGIMPPGLSYPYREVV
jgi:hypothetical protein